MNRTIQVIKYKEIYGVNQDPRVEHMTTPKSSAKNLVLSFWMTKKNLWAKRIIDVNAATRLFK